MPTKQPTTCAQQVQIIKSKGFIVDDEQACEEFFKLHNFYRVKAYRLPFRHKDGTYDQGIPFTRIQRIYAFDGELRNLLTKVIESIEMYCRTCFARQFTDAYGPLGYMDENNFSIAHNHQKFIDYIDRYIEENKKTPVVMHHKQNFNGDFPIWVMIEYFSLGTLSYFYCDMCTQDQKAIAAKYGTSVPCLKSWMRCITDLRNRCAHFSRLYFWAFPSVPKMPAGVNYKANHSLFSQVLMLSYLNPDHTEWNQKILVRLEELINEYSSDISLNHIGFPKNWKDLLNR